MVVVLIVFQKYNERRNEKLTCEHTIRSVVQRSLDLLHALIQQSFCRVLGSQMDKNPHHGIELCIWILPHMFNSSSACQAPSNSEFKIKNFPTLFCIGTTFCRMFCRNNNQPMPRGPKHMAPGDLIGWKLRNYLFLATSVLFLSTNAPVYFCPCPFFA